MAIPVLAYISAEAILIYSGNYAQLVKNPKNFHPPQKKLWQRVGSSLALGSVVI